MRDTTVAARYAKALFLVTEKRGETSRALEDLAGAAGVLEPGSRTTAFFLSPRIRLADKRQALRKAFDGRVVPLVTVFVDLLLRKKRLRELPTVLDKFRQLVERAQGIQRAEVVSAVPLTGAERERLHRELERTTGSRILATLEVDPALLGGVLVRIGDRVIDRTVRTLLDRISRQLYEVSV